MMLIAGLMECKSLMKTATLCFVLFAVPAIAAEPPVAIFNRPPLAEKPYAELPLGAIKPDGWLRDELQRMADGMTGNLDQWYPEVCGPRNAWLGGDGDTWERGPYWIDGLYPLAKLLGDKELEAKSMKWVDWTLENQRHDGYIGPRIIKPQDRQRRPPLGALTIKPDDWWPRMVMLKILQQHYIATGDARVIDCLHKYFRYQLKTLPSKPLHDPDNPNSGSWWAARRGGDNLMSVLWFYNVTGETYLLELADLLQQQTVPVTQWFSMGPQNRLIYRSDQHSGLHCVNVAMMMKTPVIAWQRDQDVRHLQAVESGFEILRRLHGQPNGLYGGDEGMHGDSPDRGSELCSAVEMMFSLEKMFEITGDVAYADRMERIALNALPTQCTDDHHARQYFQQTNQVAATLGDRDFFDDGGERVVYGLLNGYPCCTCNLHQGWPKFTQHLWFASNDGGIAAMSYAPSNVTATVAGDKTASVRTETGYPFQDEVRMIVSVDSPIEFPIHLRIPGWADVCELTVRRADSPPASPPDGRSRETKSVFKAKSGTMHVIDRVWQHGDEIVLKLPMQIKASTWYARSKAIERGPLVFALDLAAEWLDVPRSAPDGVPASAMHRGYREARSMKIWNYALAADVVNQPSKEIQIEIDDRIADNPWTSDSAPVRLKVKAHQLPSWTMQRNSAAPPPLSPVNVDRLADAEELTLIPYGATTLRVTTFPWVAN